MHGARMQAKPSTHRQTICQTPRCSVHAAKTSFSRRKLGAPVRQYSVCEPRVDAVNSFGFPIRRNPALNISFNKFTAHMHASNNNIIEFEVKYQ